MSTVQYSDFPVAAKARIERLIKYLDEQLITNISSDGTRLEIRRQDTNVRLCTVPISDFLT